MTEIASHAAASNRGGLTILHELDAQGVVLVLTGELDLVSAPELDRQVRALGGASHGRLLIDLSGLEFMDSTGLASMIHAQRSAAANGHELSLRRGPDQVQRLLELTGLSGQFTFEQ